MTVSVELHRTFKVQGLTSEQLDAHTDELMDALLRLERPGELCDSSVSADLGQFIVEIDIVGMGDNFDAAALVADSAVRAAIHELGGATPGWIVATIAQHTELVAA